jgi:uncharacterized protein YjaG (DUF416 family)
MTYKEFIQLFNLQTSTLSYEKQMNLAIAVCKKLFRDYRDFSLQNDWGNSDLILDTIKFIESFKNVEVDKKLLKQKVRGIENITPDTEDFGDASYALNSCIVVCETLDFMADKNHNHIYVIGTCFTDTVDFKIQEDDELTEELIDRNPEMVAARMFLLNMSK